MPVANRYLLAPRLASFTIEVPSLQYKVSRHDDGTKKSLPYRNRAENERYARFYTLKVHAEFFNARKQWVYSLTMIICCI